MPEASYPACIYGIDTDPMEGYFASKKTGSWVSKALCADAWPNGLVIDELTVVVGKASVWPLTQAQKSIDYGDSWTAYDTPIEIAFLFTWNGVLYGLRSYLQEITSSTDGGVTWAEETAFFPGTWDPNWGAVFLDAEGRFHVTYVVGEGEGAEWRYRRTDDLGSTWESEQVLDTAGALAVTNPFQGQSVVARDGHVFASCHYHEYDSKLVDINGSQIQYYWYDAILVAYSHDAGDSWAGPITIEDWTVPYGPDSSPDRWALTDSRLCSTDTTVYETHRCRWTAGWPQPVFIRDWRCTNWTAGAPSFAKAQEVIIGDDIVEHFLSTRWDPADDRFALLYVEDSGMYALYEWTKAGATTKIVEDALLAWWPGIASFAPLLRARAYTYFF